MSYQYWRQLGSPGSNNEKEIRELLTAASKQIATLSFVIFAAAFAKSVSDTDHIWQYVALVGGLVSGGFAVVCLVSLIETLAATDSKILFWMPPALALSFSFAFLLVSIIATLIAFAS